MMAAAQRESEASSVTPSRVTEIVSLAYILAPVVIFLFGYVRPYVSVPVVLVTLAGAARAIRARAGDRAWPTLRPFDLALFALAFAFAIAVGMGGFAAQDGDYVKHNAVFKDLMELEWPLAYEETASDLKPRVLNIYIGYYLVPALVGKWLGVNAGFAFSLLWGALGIYLALVWFLATVQRRRLWIALLFLLFGGMDLLGFVLVHGRWPLDPPTTTFANWPVAFAGPLNGLFWIFPPNPSMLANGPHHVLPTWIAMLMMLHDGVRRRSPDRVIFLWGTMTYVSAFVALGALPYVACALAGKRLRAAFTFENVAAAAMVAVSGLYMLSNDGQFVRGFVWEFVSPLRLFSPLLLFYLTSIGVYLACWPTALRQVRTSPWAVWLYVAIGCVLVMPLYRMGFYMDFPIKALSPTVVVFAACFVDSLGTAWDDGDRKAVKAALMAAVAGTFSGLMVVGWALDNGFGLRFYRVGIPAIERMDEIGRRPGGLQLFSSGHTFFWRHVAKPPAFAPARRR